MYVGQNTIRDTLSTYHTWLLLSLGFYNVSTFIVIIWSALYFSSPCLAFFTTDSYLSVMWWTTKTLWKFLLGPLANIYWKQNEIFFNWKKYFFLWKIQLCLDFEQINCMPNLMSIFSSDFKQPKIYITCFCVTHKIPSYTKKFVRALLCGKLFKHLM